MRPALMTVTYTKTHGVPAVHRWPGGLVATTMPWTGGVPHDLGHWLLEAQVDLPWGFWSLAGQRAPFESFTLVTGRWPKGRAAWLDRVRRKHGTSMLHAEGLGGMWLADPELDVHGSWPHLRRRLAKAYTFADHPLRHVGPDDVERLRPFAIEVVAHWERLPDGAALQVSWPGTELPVVVAAPELERATLPRRTEKAQTAVRARHVRRQQERSRPRRR